MLVSLIAITVLTRQSSGIDTAKPITYEANALTARKVMADLSQLSGVHLEAVNEALTDRLILHFENAPLKDVLDKIAHISYGLWEPADGGLRLRRDPKKLAENHKVVRDLLIAEIKKSLEGMRKKLTKEPTFQADKAKELAQGLAGLDRKATTLPDPNFWNQQTKIQQQLPIGRAMDRILLTFAPEILADIPVKSKVVLSSTPNSMQYALPESAMAAINTLIQEQEVWAAAAQQYIPDNSEGNVYYLNGMSRKSFRKVTKALVTFTRWNSRFGVQAELLLADAKGNIVDQSSSQIGIDIGEVQADPGATPVAVQNTQNPKSEEPLPLPAVVSQMANLFGWEGMRAGNAEPKIDPEFKNEILHPTKFDPLGLAYGSALLAMSRSRHENLAALADDEMLSELTLFVTNKGLNQGFLRSHKKGPGDFVSDEFELTEHWFTARPKDMSEYADNQSDRSALEALLLDLDANGKLSVELLADFAVTAAGEAPQSLLAGLANGIVPRSGSLISQNDWDTLRFYGSLKPYQRTSRSLQQFGDLDQFQLSLANKLVFGNYSRLGLEAVPVTTESSEGVEEDNGMGSWNKITREQTEALPTGILPRATFQITPKDGTVILSEMQYGAYYQGVQMQEPENMAWMVYQTQHPNGSDNWKVLSFQAAEKHEITINFNLAPKVTQNMSLTECKATGKRSANYKDLPDDLKNKLASQVAELEKQMSGSNFGQPVTTNTGVPH